MTQDSSGLLLSYPQCDFLFHPPGHKMVAPPRGVESKFPGGKMG